MKLVVIPACGGGKRILPQNIKLCCGKPLTKWSLDVALLCGRFDQVLVSIAKDGRALANDVEPTEGQQKRISAWS